MKTHGLSTSKEYSGTYNSWMEMRKRCFSSSYKDFKYYGGRGVSVCLRWNSFETFLNDMGKKPRGMTLERMNNDNDYMPSNCRWATRSEQVINRRVTKFASINGKKLCLAHWANELGISSSALYHHMKKSGLTAQQEIEWRIKK